MIFLDAMIVNVAIPDIQQQFSADESDMQWVVAAYSLTMAMFIMSGGTFGDHYGRRLGYIVGIVVFCLASVGCGLSPNIAVLIVARGFQGIGAAIVNVASLALVSAAFTDPKAKAKAIGIWTGIAAIGLAIGPTLGGVLTEHVGWRSIFLFNPLIGIAAIVLTLRFVAESRDTRSRSLDVPGQLLFIGGIGLVTYALIQGGHSGWLSPVILGSFTAGALVLVLFVRYELRASDPMMDINVFKNRVYNAAIYAVFATMFCVYGALFITTQYFQNVRSYSPEQTGLMLLAMTIPTIILSPLTARVVDDANPHAVTALIGPGKPLPQNVTEDDAVLNAADDAFITGIRVAMLLGFHVSLSSLTVDWWLFPRRGTSTVQEVALEPG
jgi:EmrB/QacA subfamily drug resistance transporter